MSLAPIPNLPASIALTGAELMEAVQAGGSVRVTTAQIAGLATQGGGGGSSYTEIQNATAPVALAFPNIEVFFNASGGSISQIVPALSTFSTFVGKLKFKFWKTDPSGNTVSVSFTLPDTVNGSFSTPIILSVQGSSLEIEINFNLAQWMVD